ncbi:Aminoglycoside N3'-acetyltransferase-like protein [Magnetococcus marinus MC-1]|uniref:Aminoglycoside N(3)-acetyltransferase n=1 Tax=Magnetococcus marinus (strain ATCC BAA-1437 / JCM 17883 / MC-1) TaxID=156889 RepID=A0L6S5_MAGMM|nr:AAC(3) family N-acetyltransferase [Magnetococcus marinus]ABK43668.1 Aminoglycoside N3'-acetyltransferase-like protein [Magnetococcus marinus MC-1]
MFAPRLLLLYLPQPLERRLLLPFRAIRAVARKARGYQATMSVPRFAAALDELGITAGKTILLHSSMDQLVAHVPELKPFTLIQLLKDKLGPQGTLLMPAYPFRGAQADYARQAAPFNPARTPSRSGLLTEMLRRDRTAIRSWHPTHAMVGWGQHAEALLADHHKGHPFGPTSPFQKLAQQQGEVMGLGVGLESYSLLHVPETMVPELQRAVYYDQPYPMQIVVQAEQNITCMVPLLRMGGAYRRVERVARILRREQILWEQHVHGLRLSRMSAAPFIQRALTLQQQGRFLFDPAEVEAMLASAPRPPF